MVKVRRTRDICYNCAEPLGDLINFCPKCGQENHERRATFKELTTDFLGDYFTFDSKFFRSLLPLLFRPGQLTKEFNLGRRVRYIPPLRLYIFISVLYFFLLSLEGGSLLEGATITRKPVHGGASEESSLQSENIDQDEQLDSLVVALEKKAKDAEGWTRPLGNLAIKLFREGDTKAFTNYMMKSFSIMVFFLMPVFALMLMLFLQGLKKYYVEHLIFSVHLHSFYFLIQSFFLLFHYLVFDFYGLNLVFPILLGYFFLALKKVYDIGTGKAIARGLLIALLYTGVIGTAVIATIFVGVVSY